MDIHNSFRVGALKLAEADKKYTDLHKAHGIEETNWMLLTQEEYWQPNEARAIRSILANVVEVSMNIAGLPPLPMPGQYVAAVIATIVAPCNRMIACVKAPDTFDAVDASGLLGTSEVRDMPVQQLMGLVIAYSGGSQREPAQTRLPASVTRAVAEENKSTRKKALA